MTAPKHLKRPIAWKRGDLCISGTYREREIRVFLYEEGQWANTIRLGDPMPDDPRSPHHDSSMIAELRKPTLAEVRLSADVALHALQTAERVRTRLVAEIAERSKT